MSMYNSNCIGTMQWNECSSTEGIGSSSSAAPTIKNHTVTHFARFLYCFGGYDGRRNHNDLLLYDLTLRRWVLLPEESATGASSENGSVDFLNNNNSSHDNSSGDFTARISVQGTPPPGRNGHSATLAAEDAENGRIFIIGGWLGTGPLATSDMHVLDISAGGRLLRWYQPPIKGTPPGPCNMHSADYVPNNREVYVFRGGNGREYLNDLHALNVTTMTWRRVATTGEIPQQRANHSSAMLEETCELFIFGGWNGTERLNDIHILDTVTSTWTFPKIGGVLPHPRAGMTLTAWRGRLYLFGGSGTAAKCFQDLQILDRQEMAWLDVSQYDVDGNGSAGRNHLSHNAGNLHYDPQFHFGGSSRAYDDSNNNNNRGNALQAAFAFRDEPSDADAALARPQQGGAQEGGSSSSSLFASSSDWRARDMAAVLRAGHRAMPHASPNPNDEDTVPSILVRGHGPGRRAGHTATAVNRRIYVFGGSCGSEYLNDFFVLDTDPAPRAIVTEPTSLQLFERRLRHFFNDEEFADVTFVVQGQKVYGHKMILSIVSDCFRAMFTTGFRESDEMEIEIPDCSHTSFLAMMEYIYTGALPYLDIHHDNHDRNLARVVEMLELSDRFFLDHLKQICESKLHPAVNAETVEYLLSVAQKTNASQLQTDCEHFLRNRDRGPVAAAVR